MSDEGQKPKRQRATQTEVEQRALALVPLLLDGIGRAGLSEYALKMWGVEQHTVDQTYLPRAREILREQAKDMLAEPIEAKILRVYYKAMKDGKYQTALACLAELNRMSGNYAPAKAQLEVSDLKVEVVFVDGTKADEQD